jgi:glucose-6-phosphate 1-dehydrogenase
MDFSYDKAFNRRSPEAYERLLLDALRGDASLFTRSDEVEEAWRFISSIQNAWKQLPDPAFPNYEPASPGPAEAKRLLSSIQARRQ